MSTAELAPSPLRPPSNVVRSSFYNWHERIVGTPAVHSALALLELSQRIGREKIRPQSEWELRESQIKTNQRRDVTSLIELYPQLLPYLSLTP